MLDSEDSNAASHYLPVSDTVMMLEPEFGSLRVTAVYISQSVTLHLLSNFFKVFHISVKDLDSDLLKGELHPPPIPPIPPSSALLSCVSPQWHKQISAH